MNDYDDPDDYNDFEDYDELEGFSFGDFTDDIIEDDTSLDVPFVPTDEAVIEAMLNLADVGPKDVLYDLGSGDGRIVVAAALQRNTRGIGIELDPLRIAEAMEYAGDSGVEYLVDFIEENIFSADVSEATVVTLYLLQSINVDLRPRLLEQLRPGSRIVSHAFDMGDWKPDERLEVGGIGIYKWVVPARVAGQWQWSGHNEDSYRVELEQKYQVVKGKVWINDKPAQLDKAHLRGVHLELSIREHQEAACRKFTLSFDDNGLSKVWDQGE